MTSGSGPSPAAAIRLTIAGFLVVFIAMLGVANVLLQLRDDNESLRDENRQLTHGLAYDQAQIAELETQIQDLKERWYGDPAIYQPPPIANTNILFFDVTGTTQAQLIDSLDHSDICSTYPPCAVDPAVPNGVAWGLQGDRPAASTYYCYSPASTTVPYVHFVVLPRWSPPADGTVKIPLVEKWNDLAKSIYVHEAGHVAIAEQDIAALNSQAQQLSTCSAVFNFWNDPHVFDKLNADQTAYHARLRADCRPEIGCIPQGWEGW